MGLFDKKTVVEKYEDQFKVEQMQNKHLFYDLYARVGDPEELRGYVVETLQDMDWKTTLNELTKFEEMELEGIFRGGRLKPFKTVVKTYKTIKKGSKFPWLWKVLFMVGCIFLGAYLISLLNIGLGINSDTIIKITPVWFILAILVYMIKEQVAMAIWVKIAGVYDVASEEADLRIVIAADAEKKDKEAFEKLEEDVSEFYNVLTRKYVKKIKREATKTEIIKEMEPTEEEPEVRLMKSIKDVDTQIAKLEKSFVEGKMKEETYRQVKDDLVKRKSKLETISDLISLT
jgi:hypothetical protein